MAWPTIILAGLRLMCVGCGSETYFAPPRGTTEVASGADVCSNCKRKIGVLTMEQRHQGNESAGGVAPCETCAMIAERPDRFGPSHEGSRLCRNAEWGNGSIASGGTRAHCTCAGCF